MKDMKEGQYYYAPHRSSFGVWKAGATGNGGVRADTFISDFPTRIQAESFVYKMNGWKKQQ